jgi:hypothetical protein
MSLNIIPDETCTRPRSGPGEMKPGVGHFSALDNPAELIRLIRRGARPRVTR